MNRSSSQRLRRRNVVHLIPQDGVGGVEAAARSMAIRKDLSCNFTLRLLAGRSLLTDKALVRESRFRSINNPVAHLSAAFSILAERPDLLICSLWRSMPVGLLVKLLHPGTRLVCFLHLDIPLHFLDWALNGLALRFCDSVWADSLATLQARNPKPRVPCRVISFVTERREAPEPELRGPAPRFVSWQRLHHTKGVDRALRFMAQISTLRPDASFEIWGRDDGELAGLQRLVSDLGLRDIVRFMGPASAEHLPAIARRHSFYLQLSRHEGMAMSVVEAMQLGLVPVVTAVGEIKRYCQPGRTGVLCGAECDAEQLGEIAAEVSALLDNPTKYHQIRQGAQDWWRTAPVYAEDICTAALESVVAQRSGTCADANEASDH